MDMCVGMCVDVYNRHLYRHVAPPVVGLRAHIYVDRHVYVVSEVPCFVAPSLSLHLAYKRFLVIADAFSGVPT